MSSEIGLQKMKKNKQLEMIFSSLFVLSMKCTLHNDVAYLHYGARNTSTKSKEQIRKSK